jgi:hypothetical protein
MIMSWEQMRRELMSEEHDNELGANEKGTNE